MHSKAVVKRVVDQTGKIGRASLCAATGGTSTSSQQHASAPSSSSLSSLLLFSHPSSTLPPSQSSSAQYYPAPPRSCQRSLQQSFSQLVSPSSLCSFSMYHKSRNRSATPTLLSPRSCSPSPSPFVEGRVLSARQFSDSASPSKDSTAFTSSRKSRKLNKVKSQQDEAKVRVAAEFPDEYPLTELDKQFFDFARLCVEPPFTYHKIKQAEEMIETCSPIQDILCWNILLLGHQLRRFKRQHVPRIHEKIKRAGLKPSHRTYSILIRSAYEAKNPEEMYRLWEEMLTAGFRTGPEQYTVFTFLEMRQGNLDKAVEFYWRSRSEWPTSIPVTFQVGQVMNGFSKQGRIEEMQQIYDDAVGQGMKANVHHYTTLLTAYTKAKNFKRMAELMEEIYASGIEPNPHLLSAFLAALGRLGKADISEKIFWRMTEEGNIKPALHHYVQMIYSHAAAGNKEKALEWFKRLPVQNRYGFNGLMEAFARSGHLENMLHTYKEMTTRGIEPDLSTYAILLGGFVYQNDYYTALAYFAEMEERGITPNLRIYSTFFLALARLGDVHQLRYHYTRMREHYKMKPHLGHYHSIMSGCARQGQHEDVLKLFRELKEQGLIPDVHIYDCLLSSYARSGDVDGLFSVFYSMQEEGVGPNKYVYQTMMMGLTRAGRVKAAVDTLEECKLAGITPTLRMYNSIIRALAKQENQYEVGALLDELISQGLQPDAITLTNVLLIQSPHDDRLQRHIKRMRHEAGLSPLLPDPVDLYWRPEGSKHILEEGRGTHTIEGQSESAEPVLTPPTSQ